MQLAKVREAGYGGSGKFLGRIGERVFANCRLEGVCRGKGRE